jgi:hypothetical protein
MVPLYPAKCECGAVLYYVKAERAPAGQVFTCTNESCAQRGRYFEIPHVEVREHITAALLRPKLKVI